MIDNVHGSLVLVNKTGILITGKPGIGKSSLVLSLLDRGHAFVADDFVAISRSNSGLIGYPAPHLRDLLCVRSIGLINVAQIFPQPSLSRCTINACIELQETPPTLDDPLKPTKSLCAIDGVSLNQYKLYSQRSDLALLVEMIAKRTPHAARNSACHQ